ncbi:sugar ABC transporter substrate-binding protein [Ammoniphilus oxalaticus]|uniref:Sugar ABC transporter substrate-binding protein n=1 Tax=Ammoniphilus oxalaticus TaxID=66863 RepID=A0A419SM14_9BACL|nr:ABC transporter substrate-binding protein [Ammoniphilus oxalaticus]RKD25055.1 sugar ABC transporter substrate-binding protein [Ammoniphilus oxalaticus]
MRKFFAASCAALLLLTGCSSNETQTEDETGKSEMVKIGITQIVEHPSLDENRRGFIAALKDAGYENKKNLLIDYQNAQDDMNNSISIGQKLVGDKNDLILAISTPSALSAVKAAEGTDIPVVFSAVTDPMDANLVTDYDKPGGNVTGVSDMDPDNFYHAVKAIKDFYPNAKKVGVLYNSGEQNSVQTFAVVEKHMQELGLEAVKASASRSSEVQQAAESLIGQVDAFAYFQDNTVASALESVIKLANEHQIPFFAGDVDSVKRGAFAAYGFEQYDMGYKAGQIAVEILNGKKVGDIPVVFPEGVQLYIHEQTAELLGLELTPEQTQDAVIVGKE